MNSVVDETDENCKYYKKNSTKREHRAYSGLHTDENDRDEKPWQRVIFEITRKGLHLYEPVKSVPSYFILVLLGVYLLLGYCAQLIEDDMPRVVPEAEVPRNSWNKFSEESALKYLNQIVGDEPRVAGTVYHLQKTKEMIDMLNRIAAGATIPVKTDWQLVTGDFRINFSLPFVNYYQNASNVIAVLEGESGFNVDGSTRSSLLLNCHYDSVPFGLGASDNAVFCAVLVEILARLSRRSTKFKHNIVFLFNGAEENPLQTSHGFLKHRWAKGVNAVINLDAAGMNGKPAVFQVTDRRILEAYQRGTSRPNAQGVGEFLFSSGLVPSDTDFRVFRDFGKIQGIDIAFIKWGHVYHTRYDEPALIKAGVVQNAGDTILGTTVVAADMDLSVKVNPVAMVYADYLNFFMVSCSSRTAFIADLMIISFGFITIGYYCWLVGLRWSTVQELMMSVFGRVVSLVAGGLLVLLFLAVESAAGLQLRYLTQPWLVVAMFWLPYFVGAVAMAHWFDAWRTKMSGLNRSIRTVQAMAATRLMLAATSLVICLMPTLSALRYALTVPLLLTSMSATVSLTAIRYIRLSGWQHLILEACLSVPAAMMVFSLALRLDSMMLPIMGRSGSSRPDNMVAFLNFGMAVLAAVTSSGIELLFSRRRLWMPLGALLVACACVSLVPFSPYQNGGPSTQRHYWFHTEIVSFNEDKVPIERTAGVLITKQDPYSITSATTALREAGIRTSVRTNFTKDCETRVHCGLPVYRVAFGRNLREAMFLYTGPPASFTPPPDVVANLTCSDNVCIYDFTVTVAPHNLISIWPRANVSMLSWSLSSPLQSSFSLQSRPVYVILHSVATYSVIAQPLRFRVTVQSPGGAGPLLDVSLHSHKAQHPDSFTAEYKRILNAAPKYFNVATFLSFRYNYVF